MWVGGVGGSPTKARPPLRPPFARPSEGGLGEEGQQRRREYKCRRWCAASAHLARRMALPLSAVFRVGKGRLLCSSSLLFFSFFVFFFVHFSSSFMSLTETNKMVLDSGTRERARARPSKGRERRRADKWAAASGGRERVVPVNDVPPVLCRALGGPGPAALGAAFFFSYIMLEVPPRGMWCPRVRLIMQHSDIQIAAVNNRQSGRFIMCCSYRRLGSAINVFLWVFFFFFFRLFSLFFSSFPCRGSAGYVLAMGASPV